MKYMLLALFSFSATAEIPKISTAGKTAPQVIEEIKVAAHNASIAIGEIKHISRSMVVIESPRFVGMNGTQYFITDDGDLCMMITGNLTFNKRTLSVAHLDDNSYLALMEQPGSALFETAAELLKQVSAAKYVSVVTCNLASN